MGDKIKAGRLIKKGDDLTKLHPDRVEEFTEERKKNDFDIDKYIGDFAKGLN